MPSDRKPRFWTALRSAIRSVREFGYAKPVPAKSSKPPVPRPRLGLALGGGFARGLAHLGVLNVLVENHIPIDALSGTSVGSVVAAAFASGRPLGEMMEEARKIRWKSFAQWTFPGLGLATNERMEGLLIHTLHCTKFEELKIPVAVVAADISTGEPVIYRHGELVPPLRGSCSFPGLFKPVEYQGRLLVDGAIVGSVPVKALDAFGVDVVVGVHLRSDGPRHVPTNVFQVIGQAFQIAQSMNQATWREHCNLVIEPDVTEFKWDDFHRADELISVGEKAARQALPGLRALFEPSQAPIRESAGVR